MVKAQLQVLRAATKAEHHTHDYRQDFLNELVQVATAKGDNDKAKAIKSIQRAEQMSRVWKHVKAAKVLMLKWE